MLYPDYPRLSELTDGVIEIWPSHETFISKRFSSVGLSQLSLCEELATIIQTIKEDELKLLYEDYRWTCEMLLEEELYFRRNNRYRYATFRETYEKVYSNSSLMKRYLNGLLVSQVLWSNHSSALSMFIEEFLPAVPSRGRFLEIGPGHGLYLYFSAKKMKGWMLEAWDVSRSSIENTFNTLRIMGVGEDIRYEIRDLLQVTSTVEEFDCVVISEVLEHLENPKEALKIILDLCVKGGRVFINTPCNSPAPDHIYLFNKPDDVIRLVEDSGFNIIDTRNYPLTGYTEEEAKKLRSTISCIVVAEK